MEYCALFFQGMFKQSPVFIVCYDIQYSPPSHSLCKLNKKNLLNTAARRRRYFHGAVKQFYALIRHNGGNRRASLASDVSPTFFCF